MSNFNADILGPGLDRIPGPELDRIPEPAPDHIPGPAPARDCIAVTPLLFPISPIH